MRKQGMRQQEAVARLETLKCPECGFEDGHSIICSRGTTVMPARGYKSSHRPKSEVDCLRSIDASLITVRRIAKCWLVLSILAIMFTLLWVIAAASDAP